MNFIIKNWPILQRFPSRPDEVIRFKTASKIGRKAASWLFSIPVLTVFLFGSQVTAQAFTAIVAFGDSYTDTGRAPSSPPNYWAGRFSNGPLWIEYLSQALGFSYEPANNFAVSGTESNELGVEINNFGGTGDSANVLFAIWSGNNDFGNHLNIGYNDAGWDTQINSVVSSLVTASGLLYQKGARNIVLFNQIDLTRVPYILNAYPSAFRNYIAGKIQIFNSRLSQAIPGLLSAHPGLSVFYVDIYSDLNYLLDNYGAYGFTHSTTDALDDPNLSDTSFSGPGANYVFWDSEHPSTKTHSIISGWVNNALPAPQPPPAISITAPQNDQQFTAPATISMNVSVVANGWNISGVSFFQNGMPAGDSTSPPYTFVLPSVPDGTITLSAQLAYGSGLTINSSPVQVVVSAPTGTPPPAPWRHADVGIVGVPGSVEFSSNGTFSISGSGNDIWDVADSFHFCYQQASGDVTIVTRVTGIQATDGFAKGGLMIRETLDPGAPNVLACLTPTYGLDFQSRVDAGGASSYTEGGVANAPFWLKLERQVNTFTAYAAPDGTNWVMMGSIVIPMRKMVYVGLAVTAHNNTLLNTTTFDSLKVTIPPLPAVRLKPIVRMAE